ncbi:metal-sensitive transcriptional regulator [Qipengyuania mesophila]|nr:metal-sensitive transcriptional regulator [Qipengyuania mesophila]
MERRMKTKFEKEIARMRRIEGQARGIAKMMEEDRYCIDILQQFAAMEAALRATRMEVLKTHSSHCLEEAIELGSKADQRTKIAELIALLEKQAR